MFGILDISSKRVSNKTRFISKEHPVMILWAFNSKIYHINSLEHYNNILGGDHQRMVTVCNTLDMTRQRFVIAVSQIHTVFFFCFFGKLYFYTFLLDNIFYFYVKACQTDIKYAQYYYKLLSQKKNWIRKMGEKRRSKKKKRFI